MGDLICVCGAHFHLRRDARKHASTHPTKVTPGLPPPSLPSKHRVFLGSKLAKDKDDAPNLEGGDPDVVFQLPTEDDCAPIVVPEGFSQLSGATADADDEDDKEVILTSFFPARKEVPVASKPVSPVIIASAQFCPVAQPNKATHPDTSHPFVIVSPAVPGKPPIQDGAPVTSQPAAPAIAVVTPAGPPSGAVLHVLASMEVGLSCPM